MAGAAGGFGGKCGVGGKGPVNDLARLRETSAAIPGMATRS